MKQNFNLTTAADLAGYTGTVGQLNAFLEQNPELFPEVFREMLHNSKPAVRLRMGNAIEKSARKDPDLLLPFKAEILAAVSEQKETEVIWHLALLLGYLPLQEDELALAVNALFSWLDSVPHTFVKVNCLQSLAVLALQHAWLKPEVTTLLEAGLQHESAALKARSRILLQKLRPKKR